jgi:hypothetical protein
MQDIAPPLHSLPVRHWLNDTGRYSGRKGPVEWAPRSTVYNPFGFSFWGFVNSQDYTVKFNVSHLQHRIKKCTKPSSGYGKRNSKGHVLPSATKPLNGWWTYWSKTVVMMLMVPNFSDVLYIVTCCIHTVNRWIQWPFLFPDYRIQVSESFSSDRTVIYFCRKGLNVFCSEVQKNLLQIYRYCLLWLKYILWLLAFGAL